MITGIQPQARKRPLTFLTNDYVAEVKALAAAGRSLTQIAEQIGCSLPTARRLTHLACVKAARNRRYFYDNPFTRAVALLFHSPSMTDRECAFECNCNDSFVAQVRSWMERKAIRKP